MTALLWFSMGMVAGVLLVILLSALSINKDMEGY
jgi:hypothetical protein